MQKIRIKLAPKIYNFFAENQNAKIYVLYGGRMSGKTWSAVKVYLYRVLDTGKDGLVVREVEDKMATGIHKTFKDVIEADDFLTEHFEVLSNKIRVKQDSIFIKRHGRTPCIDFGGLKGRGQGLKGLGAYSYLFVDEAVEITEEQATILRGTLMRNKDLVSFYCFNPTNVNDWVYDAFVVNYDKAKEVYGNNLAVLKVNWYDNVFLPQEVIDSIKMEKQMMKYALYQHHYEGEVLTNVEGALLIQENIENANEHNEHGLSIDEIRSSLDYVVIGVDPAVSTGEFSDNTGIVVCGYSAAQDKFYVLEDQTAKHTPHQWASQVSYLWSKWKANYVVAEGNQGGNLIKDNLLSLGASMYIDIVHARFGKITRAEPIAALYQQNKVKHIRYYDYNKEKKQNHLDILEHQMVTYSPFSKNIKSPDNMDAMVWAMTKLLQMQKRPLIITETDWRDGIV